MGGASGCGLTWCNCEGVLERGWGGVPTDVGGACSVTRLSLSLSAADNRLNTDPVHRENHTVR